MKLAIQVNGEPYDVEQGTSVAELIQALDIRTARVAVEINRSIVPKAAYGKTLLGAGDQVEIINFVGGG